MQFQWYPGHMTKAKRMMQENLKLIDVIVELVDARIPYSSKNPDIDSLANGKSRILLMNKYDLADPVITNAWMDYYEKQGFFVAKINSKKGIGIKEVQNIIQKACAKKIERDRKRGIINRPIRAMIVGIPNVGKSTFINSFAKKACTKTGNKPGVTKGKQWIRLNKTTELLDTPGILWPKFEDQMVGLRLAYIGSIKDELFNIYEISKRLIDYLETEYADKIACFYEISHENEPEILLEKIAERRGFRKSGGLFDLDKAAKCLIDDFRAGKIGAFCLERPDEIQNDGRGAL